MALHGDYILRVLCDYLDTDFKKPVNCHHGERISRPTRAECVQEAKRLGWHITPTRAFCPEHDRRAKKTTKAEK